MDDILILGATGSIGTTALDAARKGIIRGRIAGLVSYSSDLSSLADEFSCPAFNARGKTRDEIAEFIRGVSPSIALNGVSGTAGLIYTDILIGCGIDIALANKESIVLGGSLIMDKAKERGVRIIPVDSEHSAIYHLLKGRRADSIILTASGGPFYGREDLAGVTAAEALRHPTWKMGRKITIDSATLMNKGIECIEAMQLFGLPAEKVGALVHPKSQIHGVVEFIDGTAKLLLSQADMRLPAAAAIAWPRRLPLEAKGFAPVEPPAWDLNFSEIDESRFPCFALAREAGRRGGAYPALLVGADESAVEHFLNGEISYPGIARLISSVLEEYRGGAPSSLDEAVALVDAGRRAADEKCKNFSGGINS